MEKGIYTALVTPFKSSGELDAGGCRLPLKSMRSENASRLFSLLDGREPV